MPAQRTSQTTHPTQQGPLPAEACSSWRHVVRGGAPALGLLVLLGSPSAHAGQGPSSSAAAALSVARSLERQVDRAVQAKTLHRPLLPSFANPPASLQRSPIPAAFQRWQRALDAFVSRWPRHPQAPICAQQAAEISFRFGGLSEASRRLKRIHTAYCHSPVAPKAAMLLLQAALLQKKLTQIERWAAEITSGRCGGGANDRAEAQRVLRGCRFNRAMDLYKANKWRAAGQAFRALANADPKGRDAAAALNNAASSFERTNNWAAAAACYKQCWRQHSRSSFASNALRRNALIEQKLGRYAEAFKLFSRFLRRYPKAPGRDPAVYSMARLAERLRDYPQAVRLYLRYARKVGRGQPALEASQHAVRLASRPEVPKALARLAQRVLVASTPKQPAASVRIGGLGSRP